MKKKQTFYYSSLDDEVCIETLEEIKIDENYIYISKNPFVKFFSFVYYRFIIFPIAFIYCKLIKRIKYKNKKALKQAKKTGYFVYGNHTNSISDAFSPSIITPTNKPYVIVNSKNLNLPILKKSTKHLGALPLPSSIKATKNFMMAIEKRLKQKHPIVIYPEAKIWPNYTGLRNFKIASFKYPVKYSVPSFTYTTTYQKTKKNKCKTIIYIDGPFYPNSNLSVKEQELDLFKQIYSKMEGRTRLSNFETHNYIFKENTYDKHSL